MRTLAIGAPMGAPSRVAILSAVRFYREGLAQLLSAADGICVCLTLPTSVASIDLVVRDRPDIILVDVSTSEALSALRMLDEQAPDISTVAVAVAADASNILACARAGAAGYVPTDASLDDLISTIHSVSRGELRYPPIAAQLIRRRLAQPDNAAPAMSDYGLTAREAEIVHLLSQNLGNKEIAHRLNIGLSTVKSHVHHILEKLGVARRVDAVATLRRDRPSLTPP